MFKVQKVDNAKVILDERVGKLSWVVCGNTPRVWTMNLEV